MKLILTAICFLFALTLTGSAQEQPNIEPSPIRDYKFDEWGDIPFAEEKPRLDEIARHLLNDPEAVVYMEFYAGQRACIGEAKARAMRAKNYLVEQKKMEASRIKWRDGGYLEEATIMVWLVPPDWPLLHDSKYFQFLKPVNVRFERRCKIKYRGIRQ